MWRACDIKGQIGVIISLFSGLGAGYVAMGEKEIPGNV